MQAYFTIIIPALNEEKLLPRLLQALKNQSYKNFEVILVDANSTDKTVSKAEEFAVDFALTLLHTNIKNISASRNMGALKAKGKYIFFVDADNYIHPEFLKGMAALLKKEYEMIIPAVVPDSERSIYTIGYSAVNFLVLIGKKFGVPFSTGGNFIIKKTIFEKLHGFDETIYVGEDHDIVERARKMKVKIAFSPHHKVVCSVRRLDKEGWTVLFKYFVSTLYIAFFGKITKKIYDYQMGGDYYKKQN